MLREGSKVGRTNFFCIDTGNRNFHRARHIVKCLDKLRVRAADPDLGGRKTQTFEVHHCPGLRLLIGSQLLGVVGGALEALFFIRKTDEDESVLAGRLFEALKEARQQRTS